MQQLEVKLEDFQIWTDNTKPGINRDSTFEDTVPKNFSKTRVKNKYKT